MRFRIGKKNIAGYLSNRCDKSLFLSVYSKGGPAAATRRAELKIPAPFKTRTRGLNLVPAEGHELEEFYYSKLQLSFEGHCLCPDLDEKKYFALKEVLQHPHALPYYIIEPAFDISSLSDNIYASFGLSASEINLIPQLGSLRPDIIRVGESTLRNDTNYNPREITSSGELINIKLDDKRLRLSVFDVKLAESPNLSQCGEVVIYALLLANWVESNGFSDRYIVTDDLGIWTRGELEHKSGSIVPFTGNSFEENELTLSQQIVFLEFEQYIPTVIRFFKEDMRRVFLEPENWRKLEWHIAPSCSTCDFLGRIEEIEDDYAGLAFPESYCVNCAKESDHLSKVAGMSKGMRRTLEAHGIRTVAEIHHSTSLQTALQEHSELKSQSRIIPLRAEVLQNQSGNQYLERLITTQAKAVFTRIFISVNYDMSLGVTAALGVGAQWREWLPENATNEEFSNARTKFFDDQVFMVASPDFVAEREAFASFLLAIKEILDFANSPENNVHSDFNPANKTTRTTVQFFIWDRFQFDFLKKIVSRHIGFLLNDDTLKALSWLFSPDELVEHPDYIDVAARKPTSPTLCVVKPTIQQTSALPLPYSYTLFRTAQCLSRKYSHVFRSINPIYKDDLADYIPRERMLEIWRQNVPRTMLKEFMKKSGIIDADAARADILATFKENYISTVRKQLFALREIVIAIHQLKQLQQPCKGPRYVSESILDLDGIRRLPDDSKLWYLYRLLCDRYERMEHKLFCTKTVEELDANYECISLVSEIKGLEKGKLLHAFGLNDHPKFGRLRVYRVTEDSKNAKLKDNETYLSVSVNTFPGFLLLRPFDLFKTFGDPNPFDRAKTFEAGKGFWPFLRLMGANIVHFNRIDGIIVVTIWQDRVINSLESSGMIRLDRNIALMPSAPYETHDNVNALLKAIGNPLIAKAASETLVALGGIKPITGNNNHPDTMSAQVLWNAKQLSLEQSLTKINNTSDLLKRVSSVLQANSSQPLLNPGQRNAFKNALAKRLSIIWGPPGTGKTSTAVSILAGRIFAAEQSDEPLRILVAGPTYRAVNELFGRMLPLLSNVNQDKLSVYTIESSSDLVEFGYLKEVAWQSVKHRACFGKRESKYNTSNASALSDVAALREHLIYNQAPGIKIVVTVHHQMYNLLSWIEGQGNEEKRISRPIAQLFDFIMVDESSQIDVADSLGILNSMADNGQILFLGDHLQMPPIHPAGEPLNAGYMVGSIQEYLIKRFNLQPSVLEVNYRSNEKIVSYTRSLGYPDSLHADSSNWNRTIQLANTSQRATYTSESLKDNCEALSDILDPHKEVCLVTYKDGASGKSNRFEAYLGACLVADAYQRMVSDTTDASGFDEYFWKKGVGVVTPYRAQRSTFLRYLYNWFPDNQRFVNEAVDTVERFQGGERDIIIISFGAGDEQIIANEEEFLFNLNRTNVAASRAKAKVIMLISDELAHHLTDDMEIAKTSKALKGYVRYCDAEKPLVIADENGRRDVVLKWRK